MNKIYKRYTAERLHGKKEKAQLFQTKKTMERQSQYEKNRLHGKDERVQLRNTKEKIDKIDAKNKKIKDKEADAKHKIAVARRKKFSKMGSHSVKKIPISPHKFLIGKRMTVRIRRVD